MDLPIFRNMGPLPTTKAELKLSDVEGLRMSSEYCNSWQKDWGVMWLRPENVWEKEFLNLEKVLDTLECKAGFSTYIQLYNPSNPYNEVFEAINVDGSFTGVRGFYQFAFESSSTSNNSTDISDMGGNSHLCSEILKSTSCGSSCTCTASKETGDWLYAFDNPLRKSLDEYCLTPTIGILSAGSVQPLQPSYKNFPSIMVVYEGCIAKVVIHPSCVQRLFQHLRSFESPQGLEGDHLCLSCWGSKYAVSPEQLSLWGIQYTIIPLRKGDIFITFPGSLAQGFALELITFSVLPFMTLSIADINSIKKSLNGNQYYQCLCFSRCYGTSTFNNLDQLVWEWMTTALLQSREDISCVEREPVSWLNEETRMDNVHQLDNDNLVDPTNDFSNFLSLETISLAEIEELISLPKFPMMQNKHCPEPGLVKDVKTNDNPNVRSCPICGIQLKSHLRRHMELKHSNVPIKINCPICLKEFANHLSLKKHMSPIKKEVSRKANRCRGLLGLGGRIDDDRIRCEICGELFVQRSGYNRHLRNKHETWKTNEF